MKTLLTKFRLSNALDEKAGGHIPEALREKIAANSGLRDFAQKAAELDRALRHTPAVPTSGPTLHHSIMRAVRASAPSPAPTHMPMKLGLATAFAALAAMGIWLAARPTVSAPSHAQTLAMAQNLLDMGGEISRSVPGAMVAPLSNELACVDHDIQDTTRFVLAVLP